MKCRLYKIPVFPTAVGFNKPKHEHFLIPIRYFKVFIMVSKNGFSWGERGDTKVGCEGGGYALKLNVIRGGYDDSHFHLHFLLISSPP